MEQTLEQALVRLFGGAAPPGVPSPETATASNQLETRPPAQNAAAPVGTGQLTTLAAEAQGHYQRAIEAQRAGDWAKYGDELKALGQTLDRMKAR